METSQFIVVISSFPLVLLAIAALTILLSTHTLLHQDSTENLTLLLTLWIFWSILDWSYMLK